MSPWGTRLARPHAVAPRRCIASAVLCTASGSRGAVQFVAKNSFACKRTKARYPYTALRHQPYRACPSRWSISIAKPSQSNCPFSFAEQSASPAFCWKKKPRAVITCLPESFSKPLFLLGLMHNVDNLVHYRRIRELQGAVSPVPHPKHVTHHLRPATNMRDRTYC